MAISVQEDGQEPTYETILLGWTTNMYVPRVARAELLMKCMDTIGSNEILYVGVPAVNKKAV